MSETCSADAASDGSSKRPAGARTVIAIPRAEELCRGADGLDWRTTASALLLDDALFGICALAAAVCLVVHAFVVACYLSCAAGSLTAMVALSRGGGRTVSRRVSWALAAVSFGEFATALAVSFVGVGEDVSARPSSVVAQWCVSAALLCATAGHLVRCFRRRE